jgi:homoserine O-acetyltransferase/O-succinyltransferase
MRFPYAPFIPRICAGLLLAFAATSMLSAEDVAPVEHDYVIHDYRFVSGASLPEVRIHYTTLGQVQRDAKGVVRNAVLILHGTGGTGHQFLTPNFAGVLFARGGLLDTTRYFIILPDNVGHGQSSKPSDGLHAHFPNYDYDDMVDLQHRLVRDGLGINHLLLVMGTSMGGMQTWMWGERWPDFMDGLVPLASLPTQIAGRNRVWRKMIIDDIRNDPEWNHGEYAHQPRCIVDAAHLLMLLGSAPLQWQKEAPTRDEADRWLATQVSSRTAKVDANDMLYYIDASRSYDPSPALERITAPLLAINSADDEINPPELGIMEKLIPRLKHGRYVLIPISDQTRGHGSHSWPALWQAYLKEFLSALR